MECEFKKFLELKANCHRTAWTGSIPFPRGESKYKIIRMFWKPTFSVGGYQPPAQTGTFTITLTENWITIENLKSIIPVSKSNTAFLPAADPLPPFHEVFEALTKAGLSGYSQLIQF